MPLRCGAACRFLAASNASDCACDLLDMALSRRRLDAMRSARMRERRIRLLPFVCIDFVAGWFIGHPAGIQPTMVSAKSQQRSLNEFGWAGKITDSYRYPGLASSVSFTFTAIPRNSMIEQNSQQRLLANGLSASCFAVGICNVPNNHETTGYSSSKFGLRAAGINDIAAMRILNLPRRVIANHSAKPKQNAPDRFSGHADATGAVSILRNG